MIEKTIDKLKGQFCKIVIDNPNKKKVSIIYEFLKDVDHKKDFIIMETINGLEVINKNMIVAIKPTKKKWKLD